jgi:hypothetical protein
MTLNSLFPAGAFVLKPQQTPTWSPDFWDTPLLRCYGYSLQDKRLGDCVLGSLPCMIEGAPPDSWFTPEKMRRMAYWDGLIDTEFSPGQPYGHVIALTFGLRGSYGTPDYHFYLYHPSEGFWSHKLGAARPSNLDDSGKIIEDPRHADRGSCDVFVGFFTLPYEGLRAVRRVDVPAETATAPPFTHPAHGLRPAPF